MRKVSTSLIIKEIQIKTMMEICLPHQNDYSEKGNSGQMLIKM
jgi:hypothetical protein